MINHKTTVILHAYIPKTLKKKLKEKADKKDISESKLVVEALEKYLSTR